MNRRALVLFEEDLPAVVLAQLEAGGPEAAWLIDVEGGRILAANKSGAALLGVGGGETSPPILDASMPALVRLRALASAPDQERDAARTEPLIFWTRDGALRLPCRFQITRAGPRALATVAVHAPSQHIENGPARPVTFASGPQTPDPGFSPTLRARLAHELKTPLSAIAAAAEIMKEQRFGPLGTARYVGYASDIFGSAQHMLGVIERMLAEGNSHDPLSLVDTLEFAEIDAGAVLQASVSQVTPLAERAGISLALELAPRLPHIVADVTSLRQIVFNLLTNAIKFTGRGGSVRVAARHEVDGPFTITVSDTGPGMTKREIADATNAMSAPRSERRSTSLGTGLGLGLPIVRALAEANGADLIIESAPGRGTAASVVFRKERVIPV
jgi:two-component sensor histidine kinase